jgi:antitoxin YefM
MSIQTTYTRARANLAALCDTAANDRETVIIKRRGAPDVALIAVDELSSILETLHLLQSPRNAERLVRAFDRAISRKEQPQSIDDLRREVGLTE